MARIPSRCCNLASRTGPVLGRLSRLVLGSAMLLSVANGLSATFPCGDGCTARVEPWCADSLRVRMYRGSNPLDAAGALQPTPECASTAGTSVQVSSLTHGAIRASWADGALTFGRSDGAVLLRSEGPIERAFELGPAATPPPPPPPGPPPFACQDSCSLGTTGIKQGADALDCAPAGKVLNVSRAQCCAACGDTSRCVAWAWGNDAADQEHKHNCYLCSALSGTKPRRDRDFGCVERAEGRAVPHRTNFTYHRTAAAFGSTPDEVIVGLGQRSFVAPEHCSSGDGCGQWRLNQKGFEWPLGMTKYQISVPFYVSSRRYGFLWNAPGTGTVTVQNRSTLWNSTTQRQIDFWITAPSGRTDPFAAIMARYADATGHAPLLPAHVMGFWQSKMRYRTSDELADVAQGFAQRKIPLDVLVIDFYSWSKFGDFHFDYACWPNASQLVRLVNALGNGTHILHSTYPWVDSSSVNYQEFVSKRLLALDAKTGELARVSPAPGGGLLDPFLPAARSAVWEKVRAGYFDAGIQMFWLDDTEPNVKTAGLEFGCGLAEHCGALWPNRWVETFTEGLRRSGVQSPVILSRAGWVGFQATGAVLWSSDIPSSFESLRIQVRAGLSAAMSGIPWWTTDVGGFFGADITSSSFRELVVRWYQYGALCPIFRTHGNRANTMEPLPASGPRWHEDGQYCSSPGGHASGGHNEPWAFGEQVYPLLQAMIELRESLRPYIQKLAVNVSQSGAPPMRPLFFDFPDDAAAWKVDDQFMFGSALLVAPVLEEGARNRTVYFPAGCEWVHHFTGQKHQGGTVATVDAPLAHFPLFMRAGERL